MSVLSTSTPKPIGKYTNHKITINPLIVKGLPEIQNIYTFFLEKNAKYIDSDRSEYYENILGIHYESFQRRILEFISTVHFYKLMELGLINSEIKIIDYKYMRHSDYIKYNPNSFTINEAGEKENKVKDDIHKQLIYEWAVQQNIENSKTQSEFWIPYFSEDLDFENSKKEVDTNPSFAESQIKVVKINFKILQDKYVKNFFA